MPLPASFVRDGFLPLDKIRKTRRLMIGTDGPANTGKTEFLLSAPGPGIVLALDRGFDAMLDNPEPPPTRREDFAFKVIPVPKATQFGSAREYLNYWAAFWQEYIKALTNDDARTVGIDGDSDSWELQRLATFGKLTQIPPIMYTDVNAARRAMYARAFDSGKIIIATNKIEAEYKPALDAQGNIKVGNDGKEIREWDGKSYRRQGFRDQDYLWTIQLRHLYEPAGINRLTKKETLERWGILIMKCKVNRSLEGMTLWGQDCNFPSLVQVVFPHVSLAEWGY